MIIQVNKCSDFTMKMPMHKFASKFLKAVIKADKDGVNPYLFYKRYKASPSQVLKVYRELERRNLVTIPHNEYPPKIYYIGK